MTKIPATKKMQSAPNTGALWPFYASEHLTQVGLPALPKPIMFSRPSEIGISLQANKGQRKRGVMV